jgi:glycine/D-amino acid oxidase-like deaminating enzyme
MTQLDPGMAVAQPTPDRSGHAGSSVVIVGGGIMGCAIAYHIVRADPGRDITVIEQDPTYRHASTTLCDGNVRVQFNLAENIVMSMRTLELLPSFADEFAVGDWRPEPAPRHQGNLFLVDGAGRSDALAGMDRQRALGAPVEWLDPEVVASRFPLYAPEGVVGATFGPRDGSVDPSAMLAGYRRKATALGVRFTQGRVARIRLDGDAVAGVDLDTGDCIDSRVVVNAAGAWAAGLAETAGIELPVEPVMRSVFIVESGRSSELRLPSVFTPTGAYVLPEGNDRYLMAWSCEEDPIGFDFSYQQSRFYDVVWPEIARYLPNLDQLRVVGGWAGLYAVNTLDGNAILGAWPDLGGLYLANGFSGHGFQHADAVGRHLAECILGLGHTLDLSRFGARRIVEGSPIREHAGRII